MLNIVLTEVLEGHPVRDIKLKEMLGHTPLQVNVQLGPFELQAIY